MNEIAAYLANASYVAALGGPPLADLKYGIIIVPAGEEALLFGRPPDFAISQEFIDAIDDANRHYDKALRIHDPDKDIEEYARHRFDDDFPPVPPEAQRMVEAVLPAQAPADGAPAGAAPPPPREPSQVARQEDRPAQSASPQDVRQQQHRQPSATRPRPLPKPSGPGAAVPVAAAPKKPRARKTPVSPPPGRVGKKDAPRPQRVAKLRRSPRLAGVQVVDGSTSQQAGAKKAGKARGRG
jgi:hypothetical protein